MNSINTQSKPLIGSKNTWGFIFVAWMLLLGCAFLVRGCKTQDQDHLFIFKDAISWN